MRLQFAVCAFQRAGQWEVVKFLIQDCGVSEKFEDFGVRKRHEHGCELGVSVASALAVAQPGGTLLHLACVEDHVDIARWLITERKGDVRSHSTEVSSAGTPANSPCSPARCGSALCALLPFGSSRVNSHPVW